MRPPHLLRRAKSDRLPTSVVCVACEVRWDVQAELPYTQKAHLLRWEAAGFTGAAGEYGPDRRFEGDTADQFWGKIREWTKRRGSVTIVSFRAERLCALLGLWRAIEGGEVTLCGSDERGTKRGRRGAGNRASVRCVLEAPPVIVEGRIVGCAGRFKIVGAENYGISPPGEGAPARATLDRLRSFVRDMVSAVRCRRFGGLCDTVGTQSARAFKRSHLTHPILVHNDDRVLNLEGESYYGGRCEAFRLGRVGGNVYHLDVSSMYPYCAVNADVPTALAGCAWDLGPGDQPQLGAGCGLIADVTIDTDEPGYPVRVYGQGITVWPVGTYRTVLAGPELQDALAKDRVIRWHRAAWYEMAPALASYAKACLDMRREYADRPDMKAWAKAMGVCLIGKLGQRDRRWADAESGVMNGPWDSWWEWREGEGWKRYRSISGYTQAETISGWSYDADPAIASWVTSLARMRLLSMIRCASWEETYYCDTDALMVSREGLRRLTEAGWCRENEPGFLRVKNISQTVEIHGVKAYDEDGRSVRAGRPLSVARACAGEVRYWTRRSDAMACREGRAPEAVRIATRHQRTQAYRHGEVTATGEVVPFQLNGG